MPNKKNQDDAVFNDWYTVEDVNSLAMHIFGTTNLTPIEQYKEILIFKRLEFISYQMKMRLRLLARLKLIQFFAVKHLTSKPKWTKLGQFYKQQKTINALITKIQADYESLSAQYEQLKQQIVISNAALALNRARDALKYVKPETKDETVYDLALEGLSGLENAIKKFDYRLNNKFVTYAFKQVEQAVGQHYKSKENLIRIPACQMQTRHFDDSGKEVLTDAKKLIPYENIKKLTNIESFELKLATEESNWDAPEKDRMTPEECSYYDDAKAKISQIFENYLSDFEQIVICYLNGYSYKDINPSGVQLGISEVANLLGLEPKVIRDTQFKVNKRCTFDPKIRRIGQMAITSVSDWDGEYWKDLELSKYLPVNKTPGLIIHKSDKGVVTYLKCLYTPYDQYNIKSFIARLPEFNKIKNARGPLYVEATPYHLTILPFNDRHWSQLYVNAKIKA